MMARPHTIQFVDRPCEWCGEPVRPQRRFRNGKFNGWWQAKQFCSGVCRNHARATKVKVDRHGYVYTYRPGATKNNQTQVYVHRVVMEQMLGRLLEPYETVHHKNGDRSDNRPENLELWASRHGRGQRALDLPAMCASDYASGALGLGG